MNPWQLEATGWPAVCGFFLCIPPAPTCGDAYLDYFAVSSVLRPFCSPVSLVDLHTRPHYGVRMDLGGSPGQDMYRALLAPKQLPVCRPIGCGFAPLPPFPVHADWRVGNAEQAAALATARWGSLVERIELEVLNACGIGGDVADAMSGRARGPSWQWRPVLDPRADVAPWDSPVGLAARSLAHRATDVLHALRRGRPAEALWKRLRRFDASGLGADWWPVGSRVGAAVSPPTSKLSFMTWVLSLIGRPAAAGPGAA